jgi:hypothetical protein
MSIQLHLELYNNNRKGIIASHRTNHIPFSPCMQG